MSGLWCYLLDSNRVERLRAITSHKHLSSKIKTIYFSLDPWEDVSPSQIPIVPTLIHSILVSEWDYALYNEQRDFHEDYRKQMYDDYRLPDSEALEAIFANLGSSCKLELDLRVICSQRDTTPVEQDRHQIVDSIVGTRFPALRQLTLYNTEVSLDLLLAFLQRSSDTLEEISLGAYLDRHSDDVEEAELSCVGGYLAAFLQTLLDCTKLRYLKFEEFMVSGYEPGFLFFEEDGGRAERIELHDRESIAAFSKVNIEHADEIFVREE